MNKEGTESILILLDVKAVFRHLFYQCGILEIIILNSLTSNNREKLFPWQNNMHALKLDVLFLEHMNKNTALYFTCRDFM